MSKLKILHTADIHLGSKFLFLEDYAEQREQDFIKTFHRICLTAIEQKVDLVLIAGDLFDSPHPTPFVVEESKKGFTKLLQNNIEVTLIAGTHDDIIASDSVYHDPFWNQFHFLKEPILSKPKELTLKGIPLYLYGVSYNTLDFKDPLPSMRRVEVKGLHLGLLHCSIKDNPEWSVMAKDLPCDIKELFELKLDYLALGHYHNYRLYEETGCFISYCGSSEGKRFHEIDERFVNIIEFENDKLIVRKHAIQSKKMLSQNIDLTTISDEKHLIQTLNKLGGEDILALITLEGSPDFQIYSDKIHETCKKNFAYLKLKDNVHVLKSLPIELIEKEDTVRGLFVRKLQDKMKKEPEKEKIYEAALKEGLLYFSKDNNVL
ncbi:MAG: DNA repair exonuclease [Deltaproteobacteria bacterium]|nr:DNA repair exonuclease [Deltaproteobacteria bacterium]